MEHAMTDADMIGYVLDLLEPAERRSVEHYLSAHPEAAEAVARLRTRLAPLAVDRDLPEPPPDLAHRTVARLAEYIVENEPELLKTPRTAESKALTASDYGLEAVEPSSLVEERKATRRSMPGWLKPDLIVTAGIGIVIAGLVVAGIGRTRHHAGIARCAENLSTLHRSLVSYSDIHDGHFPQIGEDQTAGHFSSLLNQHSDPSKSGFTWHDPATSNPDPFLRDGWNEEVPGKVQYAYSLGYRGEDGKLHGLRKGKGEGASSDLQPIAADFPTKEASPIPGLFSPHRTGHNVLFVGGNVRYSSNANMGVGGDDIYRNRAGRVAAGVHPDDSALGRPTDKP